jgi:hypothetical protein
MAISIPEINIKHLRVTLKGISPLIMHNWSEKARKEIRDKHAKAAKAGREIRKPAEECEAATYRMDNGDYGFPSVAFKAAAIFWAKTQKLGSDVKRGIHIYGELSPITGEPIMREDTVRVGMGGTDLRYRPEFKEWTAVLSLDVDADLLSTDQVVNLLNRGGFAAGVGDWRPERGGTNGRFEVLKVEEIVP